MGATLIEKVDLTAMLDPTIVPQTVGRHRCASGTLPAAVVSSIAVPQSPAVFRQVQEIQERLPERERGERRGLFEFYKLLG
jgi:hypothetical protein